MNEIQILTLTIAIVFPVLGVAGSIAALMYSNKRLDDMKGELMRRLDTGFEHLDLRLQLHESQHHNKH